jgi:hypothetical protein
MPIETDFTFGHQIAQTARAAIPADLLGLLRGLVGNDPPLPKNPHRKWTGTGFNMIWRPNHGGQSGPNDFFLELNFTDETLEFTDITPPGPGGIANRGLLQNDIPLGGVAYLQTIKDSFDQTGQHFEPGVWANVPHTTNPDEPPTIVRMGSIPHGTTINLQGRAFSAPKPDFPVASITPFRIGHPDQPVPFPEQNLSTPSQSPHTTQPRRRLNTARAGQSQSVFVTGDRPPEYSHYDRAHRHVRYQHSRIDTERGRRYG